MPTRWILLASALALSSPALAAPPWTPPAPAPAPPPVAFTVKEDPGELRLETAAYTLVVTRQGFGWTMLRGGAPVLKSASPTSATPNGALVIDGTMERPTALK